MDVLGDASSAIENFLRFSLDGPTKYNDTGEKYLRLYGILSATYIQQEAVKKLYSLMNCSNPTPKEIKNKFNQLTIRTLRHKLASHSLNYVEEGNNKAQAAFIPIRMDLEGFNCTITENTLNTSSTIELDKAIDKHCELIISIMDHIYDKSIKTLYKGQEKKIREYEDKLKKLRFERKGNTILHRNISGKELEIYISLAKHI